MKKADSPSVRLLLVLVVGALCLLLLPAAAFSAPAESDDIPRRADGRPDLSGTYDIATLTPRERLAEYGERLEFSKEEAAAIEAHWKGNFAKDHAPSDPNRQAPPKGGVGIYAPEFTGAAGKVGGYNAFFVDLGDSTFKIDGNYRTSILIDPPNGRYPSLSEDGEKRREERAAFRHENTGTAWWLDMELGPYDDPELRPLAERCLFVKGATIPALPGMYNNLKTIIQTDDYVVILVEWMHEARIIRMAAEHGSPEIRSLSGDSIGRWEGDTLVVHTTNFLEKPNVPMELAVEERFTRTDENTVLYKFTVNDPNYSAPFTGEYPWPATKNHLYEYACHEGNYSFKGILKGARVLEQEALEQQAGSTGGSGL